MQTIVTTQYRAEDGTTFNNRHRCDDYEQMCLHGPRHWTPLDTHTPAENLLVWTKIEDAMGARNQQILFRKGGLWFFADGSSHVFYQPTHYSF